MMNHHMPAGPGQHLPPAAASFFPNSRRPQDYHGHHHHHHPHHHPPPPQSQPQSQSPLHLSYAGGGYPPPPYYPHHLPPPQYPPPQYPPPQYPPQRWPHQHQHPHQHPHAPPPPPPPYMQPPVQQQSPYPPRSPLVVTSQPRSRNITPATRHTTAPPPPPPPQPAHHEPSPPQPIPQHVHDQPSVSSASPSPAPTPAPQQEQVLESQTEPESSPAPPQPARQASIVSNPLAQSPVHRAPFYPSLPWYSTEGGEASFPPRAPTRRRRQHNLRNPVDAVALPAREETEEEPQGQSTEEMASDSSTIAARSEPETPATSQAPSENDFAQVSAPTTPAHATVSSPTKTTPTQVQTQHARRDTRPAIAVPNIPGLNKARAPAPSTEKQETTPTQTPEEDGKPAEAEEPATPPPKPAPKSWADLVRRNTKTGAVSGLANADVAGDGFALPKNASLADALKQYSVNGVTQISFLEPRGLVNTGNMCYMNSILQVLVFCVPFYNFLDQVRQRTVHSMKSDTPLVDAMIMFMREFKVLANAPSVDALRLLLNQRQLEQYGDAITPEYVYDAIRKLDRFISMRRGHQQDAEEFLGFLLEGLHDECVTVMQGQAGDQLEGDGVTSPPPMSPNSADGWLEVGPRQKASITRTAGSQDTPSPVTKIFGGYLRSELRIPGTKDSVTLEPYKPLQLDIGAQHVNNIVDALKGITRTESLTGDFGGTTNTVRKQVFIDTLPPVLILHLKRFQYDNNLTGTQKIWKKVGYPLELEIPKEVFPPSKRAGLAVKGGLPKYRLTSVVYHHGKSAAGGHYTVDVLREDEREWVRMDDTAIRRIRPEDVAEGGAEEDPKLLAKALEQHKADQELQKQRNMYQGLDEGDREPEEDKPWSEVNGHVSGHRKWSSIAATNGTATPVSTAGKRTPTARKEGVRDNKVAYILFYEKIRD